MSSCVEFQSSAVVSLMPEFLLDVDKTLATLRQMKLVRCNSTIDRCEKHLTEQAQLDLQISGLKRKHEDKIKKLTSEIEEIKQEVFIKENRETVLRNQLKTMRLQLTNTTSNAPKEEELSDLIKKESSLKDEINTMKNTMKKEVEQYKRGVLFFKKYLKCNVLCPEKEIFIFTLNPSAKNESQACEFIKFISKDKGVTFQYVEMQPKLKMEQRLVRRLHETNDIQGFILTFWKAVKLLNASSIEDENTNILCV